MHRHCFIRFIILNTVDRSVAYLEISNMLSVSTTVNKLYCIKVVFWEDFVDTVQDGNTYKLTNLRVKEDYHTHEKFGNTAKEGCKFESAAPFTQPLAEVKFSLSKIASKEATISIIGIKLVLKNLSCNTCSKKLEERSINYYCPPCNMKQFKQTQMVAIGFVKSTSRILHPNSITLQYTIHKWSSYFKHKENHASPDCQQTK